MGASSSVSSGHGRVETGVPKGAQSSQAVGSVPSVKPSSVGCDMPSAETVAGQSAPILSASVAVHASDAAESTEGTSAAQTSLAQAEALAGKVLQEPLNADSITRVFKLLPDEPMSRSHQDPIASSKSFSVGLYVHGGVVGYRKHTFSCPHVASLLNKCVAHCAPQRRYTIFFRLRTVFSLLHDSPWAKGRISKLFHVRTCFYMVS